MAHADTRDMFASEFALYAPSSADAPVEVFQAPIIRMQIIRESSTSAPVQVKSPAVLYEHCLRDRFANCDREVLVAVLLDTQNRVIAIDPICTGSLNTSIVTMREVFKAAVALGAAAIIVAHNHPSSDPSPSPEDVLITRRIVEAGQLLEIEVLDHLILGADRFISLRERGLGFTS
jgi:DNA repair protein RadC